jgi:hypothetical protein
MIHNAINLASDKNLIRCYQKEFTTFKNEEIPNIFDISELKRKFKICNWLKLMLIEKESDYARSFGVEESESWQRNLVQIKMSLIENRILELRLERIDKICQ